VAPNTPTIDVTRRMKEANTGCALIIDSGKLVGIFTEHDVLLRMTSGSAGVPSANEREARTALADELPVSQIPASEIPLEELRADEMQFAELGGTEADRRVRDDFDLPVSELMSRNPEALHEKDSVAEALNRMSVGRYRHLPVRKSDGSYAVASIKSVLNYIAKEDW
jgi:CBS domain-containing protein